MSRVVMITTQEPQEQMILLRLSARKIQASEYYTSEPLVCVTELNHLLEICIYGSSFQKTFKEKWHWKTLLLDILKLTTRIN